MQRRIFLAIMLAFTSTLFATAGDWPAFRGPGGDGISSEKNVPVKWSSDQNIRWKAPLPRPGNGSPIVVGGKVFVVCAEDAEGRQRSLYCFDRSDGKQLWAQTVAYDQKATTHKTNPYCGSTPVSDGQRVVAWHSSAGLVCYDLQGKELWKRDLGEFRHIWGYGSSPVLRDGRVFLNCGPSKRNFVTAIDLKTGKTLWETDEPHQGDGNRNENKQYMGSWCTPIIAEVDGKDQVLCAMSTRVNAYDPATGKILWYCEGLRGPKGDLSYSSPVVSN
ncbi:MAG: PQQ-like beta-propeller repeat protein [Planctomycetales bacterium]